MKRRLGRSPITLRSLRDTPTVIAHADWGTQSTKQWFARATLDSGGMYHVHAPTLVGPAESLLRRISDERHGQGSALVGFDFPIGLPVAYADAAGIDSFVQALPAFGWGEWRDFYRVAETRDEVSLRRPFYPQRPGGTSQAHLYEGLGFDGMDKLLRGSDRATKDRRAACSIFWTLGGNQVGKGAISGWSKVLAPALRERTLPIALWPFDGTLDELIAEPRVVIAETYPAEFYGHLGIALPGSKRQQTARRAVAPAFQYWLERHGVAGRVRVEPDAENSISSGFGARGDGEDQFDAFVGLIGMLNVVLGCRPAGEPAVGSRQRLVEGWILGQRSASGQLGAAC
jgi:hypothetical protein